MKLLILGSGLMGPAAAYSAMTNPLVTQVILGDIDEGQLHRSVQQLATKTGVEKLGVVRLDLNQHQVATDLIANFDAVVAALPKAASALAISAALQAKIPLVDLTKPSDEMLTQLQQQAANSNSLVILACGLEPGLTEMMTRYLADQMEQVHEVHIKCGGVPAVPQPPLGYKILFGGRQLPLHDSDAQIVVDGQLQAVPRYSGVEPVTFAGVGQCEAWHEGFMPWLLAVPALKNLKSGTQKTIRWPGYAAKVTVLKELGLLSQTPIEVDGIAVSPKKLLDALLYPHVKLADGEQDITLFRVEVVGEKAGRPCRLTAEMIDRYDTTLGFTAMARTTAFTGSLVAQMIAAGNLPPAHGLLHPEQLITGPYFERLLIELTKVGVTFTITQD